MTRVNLQTTSTHSHSCTTTLPTAAFNPTFKAAMKKSIQLQYMEHVLQRLQENLPEAERRIFERLFAEETKKSKLKEE
jgi:hypothetical protein